MPTMGTPIYLNYDQDELDAQYNNRVRFPEYVEHFKNWRAWSDQARNDFEVILDVPFGEDPNERLDIFPTASAGAPIYVFIHGGYWYSLDKADYSYVARGFLPHGIMTVVINHGLAPDFQMDEIVRQSRAALAWLWHHADDYGGDRNRIYVAGHSAGGHLAMMQLATNWSETDDDIPPNIVKGVCTVSGIFDLEPIRLSYLNRPLRMGAEEAYRNSPLSLDYSVKTPITMVVGGLSVAHWSTRRMLSMMNFGVLPSGQSALSMKRRVEVPSSLILRSVPTRSRGISTVTGALLFPDVFHSRAASEPLLTV